MSDEVERLRKDLESKQGTINGFLHKIQELDGENRRLTKEKADIQRKLEASDKTRNKAVALTARVMSQMNALVEVAGTYRSLCQNMVGGGDEDWIRQSRKELVDMDNIHAAAHIVGLCAELMKRYEEPAIRKLCDDLSERYGVSLENFTGAFGSYSSPLDPNQLEEKLKAEDDGSDLHSR